MLAEIAQFLVVVEKSISSFINIYLLAKNARL